MSTVNPSTTTQTTQTEQALAQAQPQGQGQGQGQESQILSQQPQPQPQQQQQQHPQPQSQSQSQSQQQLQQPQQQPSPFLSTPSLPLQMSQMSSLSPPPQIAQIGQQIGQQPFRESQIQAAVSFLQNSKVKDTPASRRLAFLQSKGLTNEEIIEALRRADVNSAEYRLAQMAQQSGQSLAEALSSLDSVTATKVTATTTIPTHAPITAAPPMPQLTYPYPYPYPNVHPNLLNNNNSNGNSRDWKTIGLVAAAVVGVGTSLYLLLRDQLPTVKLEWNGNKSNSNAPAKIDLSNLLHADEAESAPSPSDLTHYGGGNALSSLDTESKEDALIRNIAEVKHELSDVAVLLREQSMDNRRILMAIQQSIDTLARDKRSNVMSEISSLKAMIQNQSSNHQRQNSNTSTTSPIFASKRDPATGGTLSFPLNGSRPESPESPLPSAITPSVSPSPTSKTQSLHEYYQQSISQLTSALKILTTLNPPEVVNSSLAALSLYIGNLISSIDLPRYRKVMTTNSAYQARVKGVKGAELFLVGAGFASKGNWMEFEKESGEKDEFKFKILQEAKEMLKQAQEQGAGASSSSSSASSNSAPDTSPRHATAETESALQSNSE